MNNPFKEIDDDNKANHTTMKDNKNNYKELNRVLEASDIILEILDARDPLACRNRDLEAKILGMRGKKKIILVLNKIDLVPQAIADKWLDDLRREFATVLFKANTQYQNEHLSSNKLFKSTLAKK